MAVHFFSPRSWPRPLRRSLLLGYLGFLGFFALCLPDRLFDDPVSTVLLGNRGTLIGARIADDGQWRFPHRADPPERYATCVKVFEDKRFDAHFGVDPLALGRAWWQNLLRGETVSGGSTITMQVVRLSRKGKPRTVYQKLVEMLLAVRLEATFSKKEILALYASNAPFGGNVVGLDAAAWKYYGRPADRLTWSEYATLAVLPNAPSLIHPGRNREALRAKRDALLDALVRQGHLDSLSGSLGKLEPLPEASRPLPMLAPHLLDRVMADPSVRPDALVRTTLDADLQVLLAEIVGRHHQRLRENQVHNAAAIVADVETGAVLAYIGNAPDAGPEHGGAVDIVRSPRSSGSILKPFLYAGMLHDGELLPGMLMPDVPSQYSGFSPKNHDHSYSGAVQARHALARSLNVPFVAMLNRYGVDKYHALLRKMGMGTLVRPPSHYGLTLVLGGAETTLWDLAGMYASMARTLVDYRRNSSRYDPNGFRDLYVVEDRKPMPPPAEKWVAEAPVLGAGALWHTFEAMQEVVRPEEEGYWQRFASARRVAWKTGTSYGFRDAWAVGVTPRYVVAVWAGNADGEGRPGLMGVLAAAPLLFDIFAALAPPNEWFEQPHDDLFPLATCAQTGFRAGLLCPVTDTVPLPRISEKAEVCPYHRELFLDETLRWRVHGDCASPSQMQKKVFLVLPPAQEHFYRNHHPDFEPPPPFRMDCLEKKRSQNLPSMELLYPRPGARIYVPMEMDAKRGRTVFEAAHRRKEALVYWHLDDVYLGQTKHFHQMGLDPRPGKHILTLVDDAGETVDVAFEIVSPSD